jgi:DNA primase
MEEDSLNIGQFLERVDIVEVVSDYVKLKKSGKNFKALCPFHPEKTPSFFVNPEKQIFHCFGCGIGGNAIKFLMNIEKISFYEAVNIIAKKMGIEILKRTDIKENLERKKLLKINEYTANFYNRLLFSQYGKIALEYLYKRNLNDEYINKFMLGFAPKGNFLLNKIEEEKLNKDDFILAGLIDEDGEDVFKNRIILPIYNIKNEIIGFGARAIEEQILPKYLNIKENILFNKSASLYGINWAKEFIKSSGFAIFVEGYFDVLKMHINGICNSIAPMGTAITEMHLNILKKLTDKILLLFDGDDPGIRAGMRNLENILRKGFEIKICMLPAGFDPDKFIDEYGVKSLHNFIEHSYDFVDFAISVNSQIYDIKNPKEKSIVVKEIVKIISNIPDEIERYEFLKKLSEKMEVKLEILEDYLEKKINEGYKSNLNKIEPKNQIFSAEGLLIELLLNDKKYLEKIFEYRGQLTDRIEKIILICENLLKRGLEINPNFLIMELDDEELINFISSVGMKDNNTFSENKKERIFNDCIKKLREKKLLVEIDNLKKRMNEKMVKGQNYNDELKEIQRLHTQLNQLKRRENGKEEKKF